MQHDGEALKRAVICLRALKRASLRAALDRVVVLPHPRGRATSHLSWAQREALLNERVELHWR